MNLLTVAATVSAAAILTACAREAQLQTNVSFSSSAQQVNTGNNVRFPDECYNGKNQLQINQKSLCYKDDCSKTSVLCTCSKENTVVSWARLKSEDKDNLRLDYCQYRAPDPRQVYRVSNTPPPAASSI